MIHREPAMPPSEPPFTSVRGLSHQVVRLAVGTALAMPLAFASVSGAHATDCRDLARQALPDATFTTVETVPAGGWQTPQDQLSRIMSTPGMNLAGHPTQAPIPAFCRVALTLRPSRDSQIRTEVWLPLKGWNGRLLGVGNFGWAGSLMYYGMATGVAEGYAVASTDTGHDSSTPDGQGGRFTLGHPEKLIDYAYRADHLMTVRAKALVRAFYGRAASHAYWIGCSLGGLEGLIEARRYPEDYDGIVAGAPPNPIVDFNAEQLWAGWMSYHNPALRVSRDRFRLLNTAVMEACASPVGKKQGFLDEPDRCTFTPQQLLCKAGQTTGCLNANEVQAAQEIYQGPLDPQTHQVIFPGPAKGSEDGFSADGKAFPVALDLFKYAAFQNPDWDWTTLKWDTDVQAATRKLGPLLHVDDNLTPFFRHGGRLLMYIGWNDGHNPEQLAGYYQSLLRNAGPVGADAVRLITIPGMGHCHGGAGCDTFSKLGAIDNWVSRRQPPEQIIAARVENGQVVRTRPICAWPKVARYDGHGDMDAASSFACVAPDTH
ncbi:tannase/feruloyl esterase family alpha/beta hydrolase [Gluconacetobacter entanii]|uniref:tannase/feruloyl esterase family alpha/beta hydrolase n=1 Tax=Gluconacetobacter entanii TaxID=108528 RepID=UPI001C932367|nr:tannase/feruloyl esterase family alpha/beta hydrolase [Gluconacetobacter entanii]